MHSSRTDLILRPLDAIAPLPAAAARVFEIAGRPRTSPRQVRQALRRTQWLGGGVARLIRAFAPAGERYRGLGGELTGPRLCSAVAAITALRVLGPGSHRRDAASACRNDLWKHGIAVGCAAELLAERVGPRGPKGGRPLEPLEAFCCGLLHDVGKLALLATVPKGYARVVRAADSIRGNIAEVERAVIGLDHYEAGGRLAQRWRLPPTICSVIRLHNHRPEAIDQMSPGGARMILLVSLADSLARSAGLGYSGNHTFGLPRELLMRPLGLDQADLDWVLEGLVQRISARSSTLGLRESETHELYRGAFVRSAADLAQARQRINAETELGHARRRCLAALGALSNELDPTAAVVDVLAMLGRSVAEAIDCGTIVAFGFDADGCAQTILLEPGRPPESRRLLPAGAGAAPAETATHGVLRPSLAASPVALIQPADDELEWLSAVYSPRLPGAARWSMLLESEGRAIGGFLWGGGPDEPKRLLAQREAIVPLRVGCALALRMALQHEQALRTTEQLAETNRRLAMAQDQMAQDRAVLCVAELAAGAAHEMNNPLMIISGRSQLLCQKLSDERDRQAALAIHQNAQRLSDMITSLMRYARPDQAEPQPVAVDELFARAMSLLADLPERQGRSIDWIAPELPPVQADAVQMARALAALLENALQATQPDVGHIEVSAALDVPGENIVLTIFDNGAGMDATTLQRAFDPFFSAKPAGRRRGMGLAVALRLVESNAGTLRLDSRLGAGTRAVITLPVARSSAGLLHSRIRKSA